MRLEIYPLKWCFIKMEKHFFFFWGGGGDGGVGVGGGNV